MNSVKVTATSKSHHIAQVMAGFLILKKQGRDVEVIDRSREKAHPFYDLPVVLAEYRGKKIVYDLWDGYQYPAAIEKGLAECDFYFKRSFSAKKNQKLFPEHEANIHPLGFNYHLTCPHSPVNEPIWKSWTKLLKGKAPERYFVPEVFEGKPEIKPKEDVKVLFLTRLWNSNDRALDKETNEERRQINEMRSEIVRTLRRQYADRFIGGLKDTKLSRALAPDLIMSHQYTERKQYLELLHSCDICIGTMGLHESIGWKTGEYVAAAKAIVHDPLYYTVPGAFHPGENYLSFTTAETCVAAVQHLMEKPQELLEMKRANERYYRNYLKPEVLVSNTLERIDQLLAEST